MNKNDFMIAYERLGLKCKPLPENYNPESYGKSLMFGLNKESPISYSNNTTLVLSEYKINISQKR